MGGVMDEWGDGVMTKIMFHPDMLIVFRESKQYLTNENKVIFK